MYNRGSVVTGPYDIENSAAFGGGHGLQNTLANDGDSKKKWTISMWVKRSEIGVQTGLFGAANTIVNFMSDDILRISLYTGSATYYYDTARVFRDTSAWYHIVFQCDTTDGTAANRTKLWINGELNTAHRTQYDTSANISQNMEFTVGLDASNMQIGYFYSGQYQLDGYMADIYFTDNVANDADAFGEYDEDSGIWKPKAYAGAYGDNGFHLEFKEAAASATGIGKDTSGNGHNFDTGGAHPSQATDTPTNNFAVGNTLNPSGVFSEGATRWVSPTGSLGDDGTWNLATMALTGGNWYCEAKMISTTNTYYQVGINPYHPNDSFASRLMYRSDGNIYNAGSGGNTSGHTTYTAGDIIGMAYNTSANTVIFSKNGTAIVTKTAIARDDPYFFGGTALSSGTWTADYNFGGYANYSISSPQTDANGYGTFEYAPPTGYYALCTKNLAEFGG